MDYKGLGSPPRKKQRIMYRAPPIVPQIVPQDQYTFMSFPGEIRNMIYDLVLVDLPLTATASKPAKTPKEFKNFAIFLADKKISEEAISYFYSENAFIIGAPRPYGPDFQNYHFDLTDFNRFLRVVSADKLAMIQRLEIRFNFQTHFWNYKPEDFWWISSLISIPRQPIQYPWFRRCVWDEAEDRKDTSEAIALCRAVVKHFTGLKLMCVRPANWHFFDTQIEKSDNALCMINALNILLKVDTLEAMWFKAGIPDYLWEVFDEVLNEDWKAEGIIKYVEINKLNEIGGDNYIDLWWTTGSADLKVVVRSLADGWVEADVEEELEEGEIR